MQIKWLSWTFLALSCLALSACYVASSGLERPITNQSGAAPTSAPAAR
jgi:hypothetical protein